MQKTTKRTKRNSTLLGLLVVLALSFAPSTATADGGGDKYPNLKTNQKALTEWQDLRLGMFIHWGPVTLIGKEIGWSRGRVPIAKYDGLAKKFNPVKFNADEWVTICKETGLKYLCLVTRHHDGFCLWDTKETDYNIMNGPFKRDVVKELSEACQKQGIMFCVYYSIPDGYHPDSFRANFGAPGYKLPAGQKPNMDRYVEFMKKQLTELLTNYGPVGMLWFDGHWYPQWKHEYGMDIYKHCRDLQDGLVINNRVDNGQGSVYNFKGPGYAGDFETPEKKLGAFNRDVAWESTDTLCNQWAWKKNDTMKPLSKLIYLMVNSIGGDGNFLLNLAPTPEGDIEPRKIARLKELGEWARTNSEAIYKTRGGPFLPAEWGASTNRGNKVFLHILNWKGSDSLTISPYDNKILKAYLLKSKTPVKFEQTKRHIVVNVPKGQQDPHDTVVVFEMQDSAWKLAETRIPSIFELGSYGKLISENASYRLSSTSSHNPSGEALLQKKAKLELAFHTEAEKNANVVIDLKSVKTVKGVEIFNRTGQFANRAKTLTVWLSKDGKSWKKVWEAEQAQDRWEVPIKSGKKEAGLVLHGKEARYIKVGLQAATPEYLHLSKVLVYGN